MRKALTRIAKTYFPAIGFNRKPMTGPPGLRNRSIRDGHPVANAALSAP
jgi:hypothetical protein